MIRIIGNGKSPNGKKIPDKENDRRYIGDVGEAHAAECLKKLHYRILEREFVCRRGEIDIVAMKNQCVHFVEVKTSDANSPFYPESHLTRDKMRRYLLMAEDYKKILRSKFGIDADSIQYSFDLFAVLIDRKARKITSEKFYAGAFMSAEDAELLRNE